MAVQSYLSNYTEAPGKKSALNSKGVTRLHLQSTVSILAADDDGSTYLLFKDIPADAKLAALDIERDAITGATDYDIGFYDSESGAVIDKDNLLDGGDFSAAATTRVAPMNGMAAVTHANSEKSIYELAGHTAANKKPLYDIVLTANTAGSGAGSVTARAALLIGC